MPYIRSQELTHDHWKCNLWPTFPQHFPTSQPLATTILHSVSVSLAFLGSIHKWYREVCIFLCPLISLSIMPSGSIMLLQMAGFPFFSITEKSLCLSVSISQPHTFFSGHLGYFHILIIANLVVVNMRVSLSFWASDFISFRYIPRLSELVFLDHRVVLFLIFLRNFHTVFHSGYASYILTNSAQGFLFLHSLTNTYYSLSFWW